ncbi:MAG: hypothetical protein DWQ31_17045 [Planctomycetota bacterium]|nr:MAG: hypothetical protein DWQ31_17045 [Planctomycetota bacterium]REJ92061.1 MAG: hypothetical protein DWQ35_12995 [Planctomycetota bacterium]REK28597.1 MAG: hypothetical protein DWQ42_04585 [Planctomycetota bacterium]
MLNLFIQKAAPEIKAGDLIGSSGHHLLGAAINLATYGIPFWGLSHVGIIGEHNGELLLFEATTLSDLPCVIQGKPVDGTQAHRLGARLESYRGKVWHYPLYRPLYAFEQERLSTFLVSHIGVDYDAIGAFRAGGVGWSWIESKLYRQNLSSLFCSELCAAAHAHIGVFRTDHASRWSPNRLCRTERRRGILLKPWRLK